MGKNTHIFPGDLDLQKKDKLLVLSEVLILYQIPQFGDFAQSFGAISYQTQKQNLAQAPIIPSLGESK